MTRPVQRLGLSADGVHRYLYARSRGGELFLNPSFPLEYGTDGRRFAELCQELELAGDLVATGPNRTRLKSFAVSEPEDYDSNDERLGQTSQPHARARVA